MAESWTASVGPAVRHMGTRGRRWRGVEKGKAESS